MFEFMQGGRSAVVDNEGKRMSAFAQSVDKNRGRPAPMASGKLGAGGKPGANGKPGAGGPGGSQSIEAKAIERMQKTINDAKAGDADAKKGLGSAYNTLLDHEKKTGGKQAKALGGKGGK